MKVKWSKFPYFELIIIKFKIQLIKKWYQGKICFFFFNLEKNDYRVENNFNDEKNFK